MKEIITRKQALATKCKFYFTGKPCRKGHVSERWTSCGQCVECRKEYDQTHADEQRKIKRSWKLRNIEKVRESERNLRKKNPEKYRRKYESWALKNTEKVITASLNWRKRNLDKRSEIEARRRAAKRRAVPGWYDAKKVEQLFAERRELSATSGVQYAVDHIVPLISEIVCGLHWHVNMQVITAKENSSKGNRYWPDMPEITQDLLDLVTQFKA